MEIELPDGTVLEAPDDADVKSVVQGYMKSKQAAPQQRQGNLGGNMFNAATRMLTKGLTAPPLLAMDLGVALRNVGGNLGRKALGMEATPDYELPSRQFEREVLDRYTTPPAELAGKVAEFGGSVAAGAGLPNPQIANIPANFARALTPAQQTIAAGQKIGLAVPPSTVKPTLLNKALETVGGKVGTAQDAALKNQAAFNEAARRAIGVADETPLTPELLDSVRAQAGQAFEELRGVGTIAASKAYSDALEKIAQTTHGAAKSFPGLASNEIDDVVKTLNQREFDADSAVDAMSVLRDKAAAAYSKGDKALGKAYRSASKAIEDELERALQAAGKVDLLKNFRAARELIAKTYSVGSALNASTGNVAGTKLAQQLAKGKPLSGDLKTAAAFAQAAPKAAREVVDSGSVRNTDLIVGGGTAAMSSQPWYLLYPFLRQAARAAALSPGGQRALTQPMMPSLPPGSIFPGAVAAEELTGY